MLLINLSIISIIRPRRSRSAAAYSRQTFPRTFCRSVRASVGLTVHCGKTADWIRMPFGIIGRTGLMMRHILGFGNRFTGRGTFGGAFGARHCNHVGTLRRTCATAPRRGPLPKLLWANLLLLLLRPIFRWFEIELARRPVFENITANVNVLFYWWNCSRERDWDSRTAGTRSLERGRQHSSPRRRPWQRSVQCATCTHFKSTQVVYLYGSRSWIKPCNNTTSIKLELKLHQH